MAVGSNSLGLIFKIGVDAGDAKSILQQLGATTKAALQEVITEIALFLSTTTKKVTDEQRAMLQGLQAEAAKQIKAIDDAAAAAAAASKKISDAFQDSSKQSLLGLNQLRTGIEQLFSGDFGASIINIAKAFNNLKLGADDAGGGIAGLISQIGAFVAEHPVLIAVIGALILATGGVVAAGLAVVETFKGILSASADIGTRSKDDFEELQKNVEAAGDHITELQRKLSRGIVDALDAVKGASTGFMAEVIEHSAPALIGLLKEIADWLVKLKPLAVTLGDVMSGVFNHINASIQTTEELLPNVAKLLLKLVIPGLVTPESKHSLTDFVELYKQKLKEIDEANKNFKPPPAPFDPKKTKEYKQGLDDLAQALADFNAVQRLANEERQAIAADEAHDLIDRDRATKLLIAIEEKLFEAQKKRIEAERDNAQLNAKTADQRAAAAVKAEDAIQNARSLTSVKESALLEKSLEDNQTADEKLIENAIKLDKAERDLTDNRREFELKSNLAVQAAIAKDVDIQDPAGFRTMTDIIEIEAQRQAAALDPLTGAWRGLKGAINEAVTSSGPAIIDWVKEITKVIDKLIGALETTFQTFILTGKLGADAFRTLAAALLTQLAVEAVHQVLKMHAKAVEESAYAAQALAFGDYPGFVKHSLAAAQFAHAAVVWGLVGGGAVAAGVAIGASGGLGGGGGSSAAAGGGGFGGETKPGEITINQGATQGTLGIQLLSSINGHLSNLSTASPGDVVTRGSEQNPVAIGQANNEASRRDGSISREFLQISGLRTA